MRRRLTHAEAIECIEEAGKLLPESYGRGFALYILDLMVVDDEGVTLLIPDLPPRGGLLWH